MKKLETREQAEARANEIYKHEVAFSNERVAGAARHGFLQCWDEMQQEHEKQSLAIEKEPVSAMLVNVMRYCDQNQIVQLIMALQERIEIKDKQTCGFCVEPKQYKQEEVKSENNTEYPCNCNSDEGCVGRTTGGYCKEVQQQKVDEFVMKRYNVKPLHFDVEDLVLSAEDISNCIKDYALTNDKLREAAEKVVKFRKQRLDGSMYQAIEDLEKALR